MTGFISNEMSFTNNMMIEHGIISDEDGGVSSSSITPSSMDDVQLSYPTQTSNPFLASSSHQAPASIDDYYYSSAYFPHRSAYNTTSSFGHHHQKYQHDRFIDSSPSSNESCASLHNPYTGHINHIQSYYNPEHYAQGNQEDFSSYTFHSFDFAKSEPPPRGLSDSTIKSNRTGSPASSVQSGSISQDYSKNKKSSQEKHAYTKRTARNKDKKRCSNCHTTQSPSWRRSISPKTINELLCNACGLYEKTTKNKRMLVTQDDGATKVVRKRDVRGYSCSKCGVKDATRWRRSNGNIQCDKCGRGRK